MDRDLDLVVFGATGFTGRLVAQHLLRRAPADLRWAMAGRSADKLAAVAAEIGADVPHVIADSGDAASVRAMAQRAHVVCTTVGPYARYGSSVVEACAEAGTDYCDLTGEPQWMRRMIDAHQATAVRTGARIVHTCGFDSIPSDLGTLVVQQAHHDRHGRYAPEVKVRVKAAKGGLSGGTIASLVQAMEEASGDAADRDALLKPYALMPEGERTGPQRTDAVNPGYDRDAGAWIAPFLMGPVNSKVVRRSNALMGYPYGRGFRYGEAVMTGRGPVGAVAAGALTAGMGVGMAAMAAGPVRRLATRFLPEAGDGPDERSREAGYFDFRVLAVDPGVDPTTVRVRGDADPGYGSTSKMLGEAAMALVDTRGEAGSAGGFGTPASTLGRVLVDRLQAHAGVTFDVL